MAWLTCAAANVLYVGCAGVRWTIDDWRDSWRGRVIHRHTDTPSVNRILHELEPYLFSVVVSPYLLLKSIPYAALGPIATYRIGLAHYRARVSGNREWTSVIGCMGALAEPQSTKHIMWPIGRADWRPRLGDGADMDDKNSPTASLIDYCRSKIS